MSGSKLPKTWPVIEHDQNCGLGRIFDVVTVDHAEDLKVGEPVIVVCLDYDGRPRSDGTVRRVLDSGYAFYATVTSIKPTVDDPTLVLVRAEVAPAPQPEEASTRVVGQHD